ncbi:hypothetical protein FACS189459_3970 [Bacilli bacterium]|nr:hypothetical protein FACS189459_3970 [Bacilli bacterium]
MGGNMFMNEKYIQNETITGLLIKNEIAPHKISKKLEKISAVKKQLITFCVVSHIDEEKTLVKYNILHIFKHLHSEVGLFALVQPGEKFAFGNNFDDTLCQIELSNKKVKKYIEEQKLIAEIMYYAFELIVEYKEKYKETLLGNKKFINLANTDTTDNVKNYFSNKKIFELGNYEEIKDIHKYNVVIINKNFFSADVCECFDQIEHLYKNIKKNTFVLISSNVMDSSIKGIHYLFALNKFNIETINENKISSNYYVYYKSK